MTEHILSLPQLTLDTPSESRDLDALIDDVLESEQNLLKALDILFDEAFAGEDQLYRMAEDLIAALEPVDLLPTSA